MQNWPFFKYCVDNIYIFDNADFMVMIECSGRVAEVVREHGHFSFFSNLNLSSFCISNW